MLLLNSDHPRCMDECLCTWCVIFFDDFWCHLESNEAACPYGHFPSNHHRFLYALSVCYLCCVSTTSFQDIWLYSKLTFSKLNRNHTWVYPFLEWSQGPSAAIWYFAVGIICVVAFFIQVLIHWLRDFVARKTGKMSNVEIADEKENNIAITKLEVDNASSIA